MNRTKVLFLSLFILKGALCMAQYNQNVNNNTNTIIIQNQPVVEKVVVEKEYVPVYIEKETPQKRDNSNSINEKEKTNSFSGKYTERLSKVDKVRGKKATSFQFDSSGKVIYHDGTMARKKGTFSTTVTNKSIVVNIVWENNRIKDEDEIIVARFGKHFTYKEKEYYSENGPL